MLILVLLFTLLFCVTANGKSVSAKSAPDITIQKWMTTNPPDIKSLNDRVYVVEFWATWCHPCISGMRHLNKINNKFKDRGLVMISLCQDKSADKIRKIIKDKKINFHVAIDNGTADWYEVECYPTVAVVNHEGNIVWQGRTWDRKFEKAIKKALDAGPPPLLAGVDLGPFSHLQDRLYDKKSFSATYRYIRLQIGNADNDQYSAAAREIVEMIDLRILDRIRKAEYLRTSDPDKACDLYEGLFASYDGIDLVRNAKAAYLELRGSLRR